MPHSETVMRCRTDWTGISQLRAAPRRKSAVIVTPDAVVEILNGFVINKVANFKSTRKQVCPCMLLAIATDVEGLAVVEPEENSHVEDWLRTIYLDLLDTEQRESVRALLREYACLFDGSYLGPLTGPPHGIETHDAQPIHQPPYPAGFHERDTVESEIERMLKLKDIQPSLSARSSPVVLVPKADGSTRLCVDYRRFNNLQARDSFLLRRLDDTVYSLADATVFTTLDARAGFWQVHVYPLDVKK